MGFDWDQPLAVLAKVDEELTELRQALENADRQGMREELGDLLFAAVNLARFAEIDPEFALQEATAKFMARFRLMEEMIKAQGLDLQRMSLDELDQFWVEAKLQLRKTPPGLKKLFQAPAHNGNKVQISPFQTAPHHQ